MMELRHCSHLHFISVIGGGEQIKLLNVTRGKPVLKFKCIQEIYDCEDSEQHYSLTKALPKVDRSMAVLRSNTVKVEPMEGQGMVEDEHTRYSKSIIIDDKIDSGLDDWDFGKVTLKQLRDTCKSKKRKSSSPTDKMKRCGTTCAVPKQECIDLQADENDLDLEETLIHWKLKGSKKFKSEKKHKFGSLCSKSEQLPGGQGCKQLIFRESKGPISIKAEEQFDFSHRLDITPPCYDSSLCSQQRHSGAEGSSEALETSEFGSAEQEHATVSVASQVFGCSEVFIGHLQQAGCSSVIHLLEDSASPNSQQKALSVPRTNKIIASTDGFSAQRESTVISEESEVCNHNQVSCEHLQHADDSSPLSRSLKPKEMELDDQYIIGDQFLLLCSPASTEEDEVSGIRSFEESQEMKFMVCGSTGYRHGSPVYSDDDEIPLQIQGPGRIVGYSETVDLSEYCESYSFVEDNKCPDSIAQAVGTTVRDGVCSLNQVSYQHVQHAEDTYPLSGGVKSKVMIELDDKSIKRDQRLLLPSPVLTDDEIGGRRESEESQETSYVRSARSEYCYGSPYHSDANEIPLQIQGPCTINASSESMNLGEPWKAYSCDDSKCLYSIAQALDRRVGDSASYIEQCLNPIQEVASPNGERSIAQVVEKDLHDCEASKGQKVCIVSHDCEATLVTHDCEAFVDEKRESSVLHIDAIPGVSFPDNHPSDAANMVSKIETDSHDQSQPQNLPERLFSARKTISPTSQKKLCTAMRTTEFDDDRIITKSKKKESFEKQGKISDSNSVDQVDIIPKRSIELSSNNKQIALKRNGDKKYFRSKGNSKSSCSSDVQRFSSGCRSIQTCSQSAISFSQQQMHDIERLAVSLTTELQSMKQTVAEVLHSEARTSPTLRYNANKAMESATKVEETAKRWLSIMARDCNRFCKIMKMSQTEVASPEKNIHQEGTEKVTSPPSKTQKERKKIIFADEAGGSLCDIKLFKE